MTLAKGVRLKPDPQRLAGVAFVVASAAAFGAMAIFARYAYGDGVDTATLLALRFSIAGAVLVLACIVTGVAWPRGRDLATLVALGAVGYACQAASFFTALTLAPAGLVALLLYLNPAIVAVLAAWRGHERLVTRTIVALVVALAGTALTVGPALGRRHARRPGGGRRARRAVGADLRGLHRRVDRRRIARRPARDVDGRDRERCGAVRGARARARGRAAGDRRRLVRGRRDRARLDRRGDHVVLRGPERIGPTRASTLSTVEPAVTVALAAIVLDERIAAIQLAGGALICAAVVLLARAGPKRAVQRYLTSRIFIAFASVSTDS